MRELKSLTLNLTCLAIGVWNIASSLYIPSPLNPLLIALGMVCIGLGAFLLGRDSMQKLIQALQSYIKAQENDFQYLIQIYSKLDELEKLVEHALDDALEEDCEPAAVHLSEIQELLKEMRKHYMRR
jgi:hypothetical protein